MQYLDTDNPAVILYHQWRTILEYDRNGMADHLRRSYSDKLYNRETGIGLGASALEEKMLNDSPWNSAAGTTKLDYRMRLSVPTLTSSHLDERLFDDLLDWEPVIRLGLYRSWDNSTMPMMTLWPTGEFYLNSPPARYQQIFPRWTFLRTFYAGGRRVWLPDSALMGRSKSGWFHFQPNEFCNPIPYVRNYDLLAGEFYRLVPDMTCRGHWRFVADDNTDAATQLRDGYAAAQRRYDRAERKVKAASEQNRNRNRVSIYVPKQGYLADADAVKHFSSYLKVHERT